MATGSTATTSMVPPGSPDLISATTVAGTLAGLALTMTSTL